MAEFSCLLISLLMYGSTYARSISDASQGCTAPNSLPNLPFFVVWNSPSGHCEAQGIDLNLTAYGIVTNKDNHFYGEKMTIFYHTGAIPHYTKNQTAVNGGLPQKGNITKHLLEFKETVETSIPDVEFNGLAVLDFESWRPHLQLNFDSLRIYQSKSLDLVMREHPEWTNKQLIHAEAVLQFDTSARKFLQETMEIARHLRPNGYWGFYGYPRNWGNPESTAFINDVYIGWLFSITSGFYPRIYTETTETLQERFLYVKKQVNETLRVQVKWSELNYPVMPYTLSQDNGEVFFQKDDLQIAITEPADMGASGVVIWGSSSYFHTPGECSKMKAYVKDILGPFVKNLTDFTTACARDLCNNHGRCVRKDYEATTQDFLRQYRKKSCVRPEEEYEDICSRRQDQFEESVYLSVKKFDSYICRCLRGFHGEYCDKKG